MKTVDKTITLPLNKRGESYHLNLKEHEIANTIILVGDPDRVAKVSNYFDEVAVRKSNREFVTHTGFIGNKPISVISTGIGAGNIDIVLTEIDAIKNINLERMEKKSNIQQLRFIRLGTTGALQESIKPDSLIISTFAIGFDGLLKTYQYRTPTPRLQNKILQRIGGSMFRSGVYTTICDPSLAHQFSPVGRKGITITAHGFYGAQNRFVRLPLSNISIYDQLKNINHNGIGITNFEMETAMIYGLSYLMGHKAISISTAIYNRITEKKSKNIDASIDQMIQKTLRCI